MHVRHHMQQEFLYDFSKNIKLLPFWTAFINMATNLYIEWYKHKEKGLTKDETKRCNEVGDIKPGSHMSPTVVELY